MERTKHQIDFTLDTPEVVVAELTTRTRYYPWWGYPWGWFSNGYLETKEEIRRHWYSGVWTKEDGSFLPMGLAAWVDMKLAEDRLERFKEFMKKKAEE